MSVKDQSYSWCRCWQRDWWRRGEVMFTFHPTTQKLHPWSDARWMDTRQVFRRQPGNQRMLFAKVTERLFANNSRPLQGIGILPCNPTIPMACDLSVYNCWQRHKDQFRATRSLPTHTSWRIYVLKLNISHTFVLHLLAYSLTYRPFDGMNFTWALQIVRERSHLT